MKCTKGFDKVNQIAIFPLEQASEFPDFKVVSLRIKCIAVAPLQCA